MNNLMLYSFIGLVILYILYVKGIILADFNFVSPKEAIDIINDEKTNVTILDVRTLDEYNTGYIKNAILIPVQELESKIDKLKKFKDNKIIVYCASGSRSISASRILYKKGYNPHNMNGGINNWKRNGYDIN